MRATPFPAGAPPGATRAIIRRSGDEIEMVERQWGLRHPDADPAGLRFIRAEGRSFGSHRCLLPASEFQVVRSGRAYRVTLEDGNWFYLAGIWRPAEGDWPEAFAVLTVEANPEVARYQARQGVVIRRNRHMAWLDRELADEAVLCATPRGTFRIQPAGGRGQLALGL